MTSTTSLKSQRKQTEVTQWCPRCGTQHSYVLTPYDDLEPFPRSWCGACRQGFQSLSREAAVALFVSIILLMIAAVTYVLL
jgi:uncharacterized paraquat-inducible protein A